MDAELLPIAQRSPYLNPIENLFKFAGDNLRANAFTYQISKESFEGFQSRVIATIRSVAIPIIDKMIASMDDRLSLLLKNGGSITKY